jgi:hypothetical protein
MRKRTTYNGAVWRKRGAFARSFVQRITGGDCPKCSAVEPPPSPSRWDVCDLNNSRETVDALLTDGSRPLGDGFQEQLSNHLMLRTPKGIGGH